MARKKHVAFKGTKAAPNKASVPRPLPKPSPPVASITIINSSQEQVRGYGYSSCWVRLHAKKDRNDVSFAPNNEIMIAEQASVVVPLPNTSFHGETIDSYCLSATALTSNGNLVWKENKSWRIPVVPGGTYHLIPDPHGDGSPLDDEQYQATTMALLRTFQSDVRFEDIWDVVVAHKELSDTILARRTSTRLMRDYVEYYRELGRNPDPHWYKLYQTIQIQPETSSSLDVDLNKMATLGGSAVVDFYWRDLDRHSGPYASIHTTCYTIDCATRTVSTRVTHNWDGKRTTHTFTPKHLSTRITDHHNGAFSNFLEKLLALGPGNSECTVPPTTTSTEDSDGDNEEEDEEKTWSSQEIVVFVPRPWSTLSHPMFPLNFRTSIRVFLLAMHRTCHLPLTAIARICEFAVPKMLMPVTRLHRYRVPQGCEKLHPPTDLQLHVLESASDFLGMSKVKNYTDPSDEEEEDEDEEEEFEYLAQKDQKVDLVKDDCPKGIWFPHVIQPYYFNFPARNVDTQVLKT